MKRNRQLPMQNGGEMDAFSKGWVRLLCVFHNNTGIRKWWKSKYNKRIRKAAQKDLREW